MVPVIPGGMKWRRCGAGRSLVVQIGQIRAGVKLADDEFGRVDILVNVGGVTPRRFIEQSERSCRRHLELNMVSMLCATSTAVPIMNRWGGGGSIVNVTSIEGSRAAPMFSVYAACKAGMISFTRTMALELGEHGLRVNAIAPDLTRRRHVGVERMASQHRRSWGLFGRDPMIS